MTKTEATKIISMIAVAFPTPSWTEDTGRLYREMILDLDYAAATAAVTALCKSRYKADRPTIAEIRDAIRLQLENSGLVRTDLEPDEAWGYVEGCFLGVGSYRDFPCTYPLVKQVVERLGWVNLCLSQNQIADRAHFLQLYKLVLERERRDRLASPGLLTAKDQQRLEQRSQKRIEEQKPMSLKEILGGMLTGSRT